MIKKISSSNIGINFIKKIVTILSGVIFLILMTRYLGLELRGEYAYIINYVNIITTVLNLGISLVLPSFIRNKSEFNYNDFASFSIYQFLFNVSITFLSFYFLSNVTLSVILLLSSISILSLQLNNITLLHSIKLNSYAFIISSIVNVVLIILVFNHSEVNLYYVVAVYIVKELTLIIVNSININFKLYWLKKKWLKILKAGFLPMLTTSLIALNYRVDIIMLEYYDINFILIGLFATGVSLSEYSWLITDIFKEVMLNKNSKKDEVHLTNVSLRFAFSSVMLFALIFALIGKFTLAILFGDEFEEAYFVTITMFFAVPFMGFVKIIGTLFIAQARWLFYFKILLLTVSLNILCNLIFIPVFNIYGAAVASIFSYVFCGIYCLLWYSNKYNVNFLSLFLVNRNDIKMLKSYFI